MSELSFENTSYRFNGEEKTPFLQRMLIKYGLAKDKKRADRILIIASAALLALSAAMFLIKTGTPRIKTVKIMAKPVQKAEAEGQAAKHKMQGSADIPVE